MLRELRERMQQLMQSAAAQSSPEVQDAASVRLRAENQDLRKEVQGLRSERQEVCGPSSATCWCQRRQVH